MIAISNTKLRKIKRDILTNLKHFKNNFKKIIIIIKIIFLSLII